MRWHAAASVLHKSDAEPCCSVQCVVLLLGTSRITVARQRQRCSRNCVTKYANQSIIKRYERCSVARRLESETLAWLASVLHAASCE